MDKKINPKSIVYESTTSIAVFFYPTIITLMLVIYLLKDFSFSKLTINFMISILLYIPAIFQFHRKKIILTKNSIYVFVRNKQVLKWSLVQDFAGIDVRYDKLGNLLGYGTLVLINKENKMYEYFFLNNPPKIRHEIILAYERSMKALDSDFICSYTLESNEKN